MDEWRMHFSRYIALLIVSNVHVYSSTESKWRRIRKCRWRRTGIGVDKETCHHRRSSPIDLVYCSGGWLGRLESRRWTNDRNIHDESDTSSFRPARLRVVCLIIVAIESGEFISIRFRWRRSHWSIWSATIAAKETSEETARIQRAHLSPTGSRTERPRYASPTRSTGCSITHTSGTWERMLIALKHASVFSPVGRHRGAILVPFSPLPSRAWRHWLVPLVRIDSRALRSYLFSVLFRRRFQCCDWISGSGSRRSRSSSTGGNESNGIQNQRRNIREWRWFVQSSLVEKKRSEWTVVSMFRTRNSFETSRRERFSHQSRRMAECLEFRSIDNNCKWSNSGSLRWYDVFVFQGMKVVSGSLDVLESVGKKTFDVSLNVQHVSLLQSPRRWSVKPIQISKEPDVYWANKTVQPYLTYVLEDMLSQANQPPLCSRSSGNDSTKRRTSRMKRRKRI